VVHLKRFQFSRTWREKIETLVGANLTTWLPCRTSMHVHLPIYALNGTTEFPVEGLDLTHYVKGPDSDKPQIYDLYGVSVQLLSSLVLLSESPADIPSFNRTTAEAWALVTTLLTPRTIAKTSGSSSTTRSFPTPQRRTS
jgi:hypothetical protein